MEYTIIWYKKKNYICIYGDYNTNMGFPGGASGKEPACLQET